MLVPRAYPLLILKGENMKTLLITLIILLISSIAWADGNVVIFSKTTTNLDTVSYTIDYSTTVHHSVFDFETGEYNIYHNGILLCNKSITDPEKNWLVFDSSSGGSFLINKSSCEGNLPPTAPAAPTLRP